MTVGLRSFRDKIVQKQGIYLAQLVSPTARRLKFRGSERSTAQTINRPAKMHSAG
jgi:hypothetical protein